VIPGNGREMDERRAPNFLIENTIKMPILGAHMSVAGGLYRAAEAGKLVGCDCIQIFTKNNNQWRARPIAPADAERFRQAVADAGLLHPIAHDSYLINLAAPDEELWRKSIEAFVDELQRAELLGLDYLVTHPGAYTSSSEEAGLARIVSALNEVHSQTRGLKVRALLETTAGQGTTLGWRFEHLANILAAVRDPERLGICVDTCHIFAAGYPLTNPKDYQATFKLLENILGLDQILAFHLNDSQKELGSRVDRHAHIGQGKLGLEPFRQLLNDERFARTPMYLETPKGQEDGVDLDAKNLATLRTLVKS
jgi:deoxyribonuclease-4